MMVTPLSSIGQMLLSGISSLKPGSSHASSIDSTSGDSSQVSPFAQLMGTLQELQQSNPAQYKEITATLASNLQQAATTAQNNGEAGEANALNQLAASFNQASQSGQLPTFMQQEAQAGQMHHHHHHPGGTQGLGQDLNSISQMILSNMGSSASGTSIGANSATQ